MNEMETMLRTVWDRQAIRDCLVAYCRGVDRLDRELLVSVYHEDAVDDHGVFVGDREAFADWALDVHGRMQSSTQHIITNHSCELDGDVAHCETYWMLASMNKVGSPLTLSGGRYIDRFERRNGRWAIALRKCVADWRGQPGEGWLPPEAAEAVNSGAKPARDRSDPSYQRPLAFDESRRGYVYGI
jgi:ketosteroid isomerase-like protein